MILIPLVILSLSSSTLAWTAFERLIILASGCCEITITADGLPSTKPKFEYDCAPNSTRATSFIFTFEPSIFERIIIFSNSLTSANLPFVLRVS